MAVAAEADRLFLVVELDPGPAGIIEGEIFVIGPVFATVGRLLGIGEHRDVVWPIRGHEELHLLLGGVGNTRYTSRNSSKGAFSYMCAPLKSGTVTMLLTIPKRYRKKNILVNMGLSSIGTAIIFLLAKLHTFSLKSK